MEEPVITGTASNIEMALDMIGGERWPLRF